MRDARELIELIESEVERLTGLLDQLLSPSAAARRTSRSTSMPCWNACCAWPKATPAGRCALQRDYDPSLPEFPGDADRLTQAVWNLVRNAIEAGAGQRHPAHARRTRRAHRRRRACDGAAPGDRRRRPAACPTNWPSSVFLPLVSGRAEGSGLGLALAQQVAREHRGSLAYRSRPGHTVFTLLLPLDVTSRVSPR